MQQKGKRTKTVNVDRERNNGNPGSMTFVMQDFSWTLWQNKVCA